MNKRYRSSARLASLLCCLLLMQPMIVLQSLGQTSSLQVYVANQGNFSDANGTLTQYTPEDNTVSQDVVTGLNTLVQSITVHNGVGYILANTSDRIDVIDLETNERIGQIRDVSSPRFMVAVSADKAYVSNLFASTVTIVDLVNDEALGSIAVGMNPEDIAVSSGIAYVANFGFGTADSTVSVIDVATDTVIETKQTGCDGPRFLEVDQENELWVFCNGKTVFNDDFSEIIEQTNGQVVVFDNVTGEEVARIALDAQSGASSLGQDAWYDPGSNRMFLVKGLSILVFDASTNELSETVEISGEEEIGAVAYDGGEDVLYLGRVTGFTEAGFVSIHDMMGAELDRFTAGVAPGFITFYDPSASSVSVEDEFLARRFDIQLDAAYPNPFSGSTSIPFQVAQASGLVLTVYNALGQEVDVLLDKHVLPGQYAVEWITDAPAGIYYYRLSTADHVETKAITLVR